ncbi:ABC transporter-like protein [Xylogone sp. PMI_703]|nr:ABC transporter-like protein [Xylogone sp. PMI_703]
MNATLLVSRASPEDVFGPQIHDSEAGHDFDFTLLFEQGLLSIGPSALLLLVFPVRVFQLYRKERKARPGWLLGAKPTAVAIFACLQLAQLVIWSSPSAVHTRASVAAAALSLVDSLAICILSYVEHTRSIRPSNILAFYLFFSTLFDIAQTRTLWLNRGPSGSRSHNIAALFTASLVMKVTVLVLEAVQKRSLLLGPYKFSSPEATSSIFNRSVFWWINSLFKRGFRSLLGIDDLSTIDDEFSSKHLGSALQQAWDRNNKLGKYALITTVLWTFKWAFLGAIVPRLAFIGFSFAQPFLINRSIVLVSEPSTPGSKNDGYGIIGATALIYTGLGVSRAFYNHKIYRSITIYRGALVSLIYNKVINLSIGTVDDSAALTHMSTDIDSIATGIIDMHDIWSGVIELGIAIYFRLGNGIGPARMVWNRGIQKRVGVTSSVLGHMKGIKMMGLADYILQKVQGLRVTELNLSKKFRGMIVWLNTVANLSDQLTPITVIAAAVFWTSASRHEELGVAQAFTALSIVILVSTPLTNLISAYPNFMSAVACFDRIQEFLLAEERKDHRLASETRQYSSERSTGISLGLEGNTTYELIPVQAQGKDVGAVGSDIVVEDGVFYTNDRETPILHDINVIFKRSTFTMIVGPVGSGKSIMLKSLLGEINNAKGFVHVSSRYAAYCDQTPWLLNATIKRNIIGYANEFDPKWYSQVLHACALDEDIARLPLGDESNVGSKGITLSGGQKQRLSLARALYSRRRLIILDGIFSGLDNSTGKAVFSRLFDNQGLFRRLEATVILATHNINHLSAADNILVLDKGGVIIQQGSLAQLQSLDGYVKNLALKPATDPTTHSSEEIEVLEVPGAPSVNQEEDVVGTVDSKRQVGDFQAYKYWFTSVGVTYSLVFLVLAMCYIFSGKLPQIFLRIWTEAGTSTKPAIWFGLYAASGMVCVLAAGATVRWFMISVIPKSAEYLHLLLLKSVMRAPLSFFSMTDSGTLLNRFSQDMSLIDQALPMAFFTTTFDVLNVVAEIILIVSGASYVAAVVPLCMVAVYFLQRFYLRTSRQMRHLDLEAKSPLYTHFTETLSGLATIRAFGWQESFRELNRKYLDTSQKPYYLLYCIQRWLNLVLDLFVAGIAVVLVSFAINLRSTTSSGALGLAMINLLGFNQSLSMLINSWTNLETSLGAINRLKDFVEATPDENRPTEMQGAPDNWPAYGEIEFRNISASYSENSELVLINISMKVEAGQKVGICGRTGSGKSSLIATIFRLLELRSGSMVIDGVDLSTVPRQLIRSRIIALPQDPIILPGTVRSNLDPLSHFADQSINHALHKVDLLDKINESGGINADMEQVTLSHGQQQLFCLANAILHKDSSRILVLDEATSNFDDETDQKMQVLIREEFKQHTVLCVAHKLGGIMDVNKIVVMKDGRLVEFDDPRELLKRDDGIFRALVEGRNRTQP